MQIVQYPHPALRHRSRPLKRVDAELRNIVREMFELMREAEGVGLAANQVDLPYRLFVMAIEGDDERVHEHVFINPVIENRRGRAEAEEGCLSLPGLFGPVTRPEKATLVAYSLEGQQVRYDLTGLPARVAQHETDHLDGVLFTDRLSPTNQMAARDALESFEREFLRHREQGEIPDDETIAQRLAELERLRC